MTKRDSFKRDKNSDIDYRDYMSFFKSIYHKNNLIKNVEMKQDEFDAVLNTIKKLQPTKTWVYKRKTKSLR